MNLLGYEALWSSDRGAIAFPAMSALECCVALYDTAFSGRQEEGHKNVMRSEIERAKKLALCLCDTSSPIAGVSS